MKITEDCINHNAIKLISENNNPWETCDPNGDSNNIRIAMLGYIQGVTDMAEAMKEVLKV